MRKVVLPGGELEYAVLAALWEAGSASAPELYERVGVPAGLVYTTVAKVLDRLHAKGLVHRALVGKSFVYKARVRRETIERERAKTSLSHLLGGDPAPAVARLVDAVEAYDPDLLDELARVVAARRRSRAGS